MGGKAVRRFTTALLAILVLAGLAACGTPGAANPSSPTTGNLMGITMLSAHEGWAVGAQGTILHYAQDHWTSVASPVTADLWSVSMVSADEAWAVGSSYYVHDLQYGNMLHYSHNTWSAVPQLPTSGYLLGIHMVTPTAGWAVGKDILHYTGGSWTKAATPDKGTLSRTGVAMVSADEGWAVSSEGFIMRCSQGVWTQWSAPDPTRKIYAISMASADAGWAVGEKYDGSGSPVGSLILRYANGTWAETPLSSSAYLYAVVAVSPTEAWAVGSHGTILHATNGQWSPASSPTGRTLRGVAMVSAAEGWAVGDGGTILHYQGGKWAALGS